MTGPFETERQARDAALGLGGPPRPGWSILSGEQNRAMVAAACEAAGVTLGTYDERILGWLAGFEDSICAVVAGLISRAAEAGAGRLRAVVAAEIAAAGLVPAEADRPTVLGALADAADLLERQAAQWCPDCEASPAECCGEHLADLDAATAYRSLAAKLRAGSAS